MAKKMNYEQKVQFAADFEFACLLQFDRGTETTQELEMQEVLRDLAVKYKTLTEQPRASLNVAWHEYIVKGLKKLVEDIPANCLRDVEKATEALGDLDGPAAPAEDMNGEDQEGADDRGVYWVDGERSMEIESPGFMSEKRALTGIRIEGGSSFDVKDDNTVIIRATKGVPGQVSEFHLVGDATIRAKASGGIGFTLFPEEEVDEHEVEMEDAV